MGRAHGRVLRNSLYALLERDGSTLPDILRLYSDETFRKQVVASIRNTVVRRFWTHEFAKYPDRLRAEACAPIQNKLGALLTDPRLYRVLVAPERDIHFRRIMDEGGALIVNLAKGRLGEDGAALLGAFIASTIGLAALSRAEAPAEDRRPFFLYIDEFQSFTTLAFVNTPRRCANTGWASRSRISTCISLSRTSDTPSSAMWEP